MNRAKLIVSQNEEVLRSPPLGSVPVIEMFKEARTASTYSFGGEKAELLSGNEHKLRTLFESAIDHPLRKRLQKDLPTASKQEKFMHQFKSLQQQQSIPEQNIASIDDYYQRINSRRTEESRMHTITEVDQKPFAEKFQSRLDFEPPEFSEFIANPGMAFMDYGNAFEREDCARIFDELGPMARSCFKPSREQQPAGPNALILDLKNMDFFTYSEAILERNSNILFESVIKSFGVMSIDEEIVLPDRYEIKEKKEFASIEINTDPVVQQRLPQPANTILKRGVQLIRLEIERQKTRKEKPEDYNETVERKLLEFFDLVLEGEIDYQPLDYASKIKQVLKDIDHFKGKNLDGQSKINLLLYFFRESKALKDRKESQKMIEAPPGPKQTVPKRTQKQTNPAQTPKTSHHRVIPQKDNQSITSRKAASQRSPAGSRVRHEDDDEGIWIGSAVAK